MASFRQNNCKCIKTETNKRCKCGAAWSYRIRAGVDPKTGKRKLIERGGFRTKKEAEIAAAAAELEVHSGSFIEEKKITFEDFAKEWYSIYMGTGKVKISTGRVRLHEIGRLNHFFAKIPLKDITRRQYQNALNKLKEEKVKKKEITTKKTEETVKKADGEIVKGYSENTIDGVHRTGRMIFKKAIEMEIIKNDPTSYAVVPRTQKTVEQLESEKQIVKYLEKEELSTFLGAAKDFGLEYDYVTFMLLAYTGMRAGELCALKWSDINFDDRTISITKTLYNPTNNTLKYTLLTPKTKSSVRTIEIDNVLCEVLNNHRVAQKELYMRNRKTYHNKDFIIVKTNENYAGYPEQIKKIEIRMLRLLKLCELNTDLTPHSLRHTHTSLLAEVKVTLEAIMERLGHQDDETTRNVYLHVTKTQKKEAAHKFSQLMQSLSP
ncbi:site-specific integrase [Paenibacillus antarcticus]|uniref:Integrase n=1 Tax=Paenibacillus antarcticus TaxID=253703 RepID=A0A168R2J1_9BACL|nr:site-specific integrase [Paenibacillus antarcticus]OAB48506.1 integrase [Paenibacillus antarcticus]